MGWSDQTHRAARRSPLKVRPLRHAGQSVQDEIEDVVFGDLMWLVMLPFILGAICVMEVVQRVLHLSPDPWITGVLAVGTALWGAFRWRKVKRRLASLKQGRDGERVVSDCLEATRRPDWRLFHDIQGAGFNVDHVLVTRKGVLALETKTFSKVGDRPEAHYDGRALLMDGIGDASEALEQAARNASWLRARIREMTGSAPPIQPVVLLPDWWVHDSRPTAHEVWVMNPKALAPMLDHQTDRLSVSEAQTVAEVVATLGRLGQ